MNLLSQVKLQINKSILILNSRFGIIFEFCLNYRNESALFLLNSEEIVDNLLKVGADPNATNKKGTTILQLALAFKRKEIAQLLLDYGAQPSVIHKPPKNKS